MLGPLCDHTDKRYSFVKHNEKKICLIKQQPQKQPQKSHKQDTLQKHLQIDQSIDLCVLQDACHKLLCIFGDCHAPGMPDAEVTKSVVDSIG